MCKETPRMNPDDLKASLDELPCPQLADVRESTHGSYRSNAHTVSRLHHILHGDTWGNLTPQQQYALDMICVKISRILNGNPNTLDHWLDIQGYAELANKQP